MLNLSQLDYIAIAVFAVCWAIYTFILEFSPYKNHGISALMANERRRWMLVMLERQLRIVDISIINGLQQGAAFYASFCMLAIGGCFALLGASDDVQQVFNDLPLNIELSRALWEFKVLGLIIIYTFAFFKFGWSYRLFMYCSIMVGTVLPLEDIKSDEQKRDARIQSVKAAKINTIAAKHFNAGQRAVFFSMGFMGWFVSPNFLIAGSILTLLVLLRRQFFSNSRKVVAGLGCDEHE